MKEAASNTTSSVRTPASCIASGNVPHLQKQDNAEVPSPDTGEYGSDSEFNLSPSCTFAYPPGENSFFRKTVAQFKLKVGQPNDPFEQEADAVADKVMRSSEPFIQRKCAECEKEDAIQMKPAVQLKTSSRESGTWVQSRIEKSRGNGRHLPEGIRSFMENGIGADFKQVKLHTDSSAVQMNRTLGARAFTVGSDVFFNSGQYAPESSEGKRLLAHELTHTIQQGASQKMVQKDDGDPAPGPPEPATAENSSSGSSDPLARMVGRLVRDQLSDSSMRGHIRTLGRQLQSVAVSGTTEPTDEPRGSAERLSALEVAHAFEASSRLILADETFQALRQNLIRILSSSDEAVLVAGLAAGLVAFLADMDVSGSPEGEIADSGFSLGGSFDLGSLRDLHFNELKLMAQYASDYFQLRLEGGAERGDAPEGEEEEEGPVIGTGIGRIRFGNEISNIAARISFNSAGELVLGGTLSMGHEFGGGSRLVFSTEVEHQAQLSEEEEASSETTISPELSGRFRFRGGSTLRLGSDLEFTLDEGLTGAGGFVEFEQNRINLRIEGRMGGIREESGIRPGGDMLVQGMVTIYF